MSFSPLGLTPRIGVFDMLRALAFSRDVLEFAVVSASLEVETAEGRFSHWMWLRFPHFVFLHRKRRQSTESVITESFGDGAIIASRLTLFPYLRPRSPSAFIRVVEYLAK
jgi:hypothetical protein